MSFSSTAAVFSSNAFLNPGPAPAPPSNRSPVSSASTLTSSSGPAPFPDHKKLRINDSSSTFTHSPTGSDSSVQSGFDGSVATPTTSNSGTNFSSSSPPARDDNRGRFIKHGWVAVKEDGSIRGFMWPKKYLVLRDAHLEFYRGEVSFFWKFLHTFLYRSSGPFDGTLCSNLCPFSSLHRLEPLHHYRFLFILLPM